MWSLDGEFPKDFQYMNYWPIFPSNIYVDESIDSYTKSSSLAKVTLYDPLPSSPIYGYRPH